MNWKKFRYITVPNFLWKYCGVGFVDDLYSYWWLNIKKRKQLWSDAVSASCDRRWCRYCGKGQKQ